MRTGFPAGFRPPLGAEERRGCVIDHDQNARFGVAELSHYLALMIANLSTNTYQA